MYRINGMRMAYRISQEDSEKLVRAVDAIKVSRQDYVHEEDGNRIASSARQSIREAFNDMHLNEDAG